MTRPWVTVREAPVITRPTAPAKAPSSLLQPSLLQPSLTQPSLMQASLLTPASSLLRPTAPRSLLRPAFSPSHALKLNQGRRPRQVNRRTVILPTLGPGRRRPPEKTWLYLPYEAVCRVMEWEVGTFTYVPGMDESFTELAASQADMDCYGGDCDQPDWCIDADPNDLDADVIHLNPLAAVDLKPHRPGKDLIPPDLIDLDCYGMYGDLSVGPWGEIRQALLHIRGQAREQWLDIIDDDNNMIAGNIALTALKMAGYDLPNGLHLMSALVQILVEHFEDDESLREAFLDAVALVYAPSIETLDDAQDLLDVAEKQDCMPIDWDALTFLVFDPDDIKPELFQNAGCARLLGDWMAVDASYHSALARGIDEPWLIGWREVLMKPFNEGVEIVNGARSNSELYTD